MTQSDRLTHCILHLVHLKTHDGHGHEGGCARCMPVQWIHTVAHSDLLWGVQLDTVSESKWRWKLICIHVCYSSKPCCKPLLPKSSGEGKHVEGAHEAENREEYRAAKNTAQQGNNKMRTCWTGTSAAAGFAVRSQLVQFCLPNTISILSYTMWLSAF